VVTDFIPPIESGDACALDNPFDVHQRMSCREAKLLLGNQERCVRDAPQRTAGSFRPD
jgi:hypothetical protein